MDFVHHRVK